LCTCIPVYLCTRLLIYFNPKFGIIATL
jgi:hypothetical protein